MSTSINPAAPDHFPWFITPPDEPDWLLWGTAVFLVAAVMVLGSLFFRLHILPEQMATGRVLPRQVTVVAVLSLLGLFTFNPMLWAVALILAIFPVQDFYEPLSTIAKALKILANRHAARKNLNGKL